MGRGDGKLDLAVAAVVCGLFTMLALVFVYSLVTKVVQVPLSEAVIISPERRVLKIRKWRERRGMIMVECENGETYVVAPCNIVIRTGGAK